MFGQDSSLVRENALRDIEASLNQAIDTAKMAKITPAELHTMLDTLLQAEGEADHDN